MLKIIKRRSEMAGTESIPSEKDKLSKLLRFLEQDSIAFGDGRRRVSTEKQVEPVLSQRVKTFYVDNLPGQVPQYKQKAAGYRGLLLVPDVDRLGFSGHSLIGGSPIILETAIELRMIVYGSCHHSFSREWQKSSLAFQYLEGRFPYGIVGHRCGSRGLMLGVQAFLVKHLVFGKEYQSLLSVANSLQPSCYERRRAMVCGMSDILWQAGDKRRCCVCLLQEDDCLGPDYRYRPDKITERLHLFEFKKLEDLKIFLKRHLDQAENGCGCILFLYSLVLSRTIHKIREDLDMTEDSKTKLLTDMEECSQALVNLILTGRAVPHLHNGDVLYTKRGTLLSSPIKGCKKRSDVGFLFWDKGESDDSRTEVGSMLKTPLFPVWVTKVNGQFGLLFSTNKDLVGDWRAEHRFALHYYTGLVTQERPAILSIDTRYNRVRPKTSCLRRDQDDKIPPLEQAIMTKWYGANVNWNDIFPFY